MDSLINIDSLLFVMLLTSFEVNAITKIQTPIRTRYFHTANQGIQLLEGDVYAHKSRDKSFKEDPVDFFDPALKWDPEDVPYFIDPILAEAEANVTERIEAAIFEFTNHTCLKFRSLKIEDSGNWPIDYLYFNISADGCYSYIGRRGGAQLISLKPNSCIYKGIIMHEIFHSLGFGHEHNRPDRDENLEVKWEFVDPEKTSYLNKYSEYPSYGERYDYGSLLHGRNDLYSVNDSWTLIAKSNRTMNLGQRDKLSEADIRRLNAHYSCPSLTTSSTAVPTTEALTRSTTRMPTKTTPSTTVATTITTTTIIESTASRCNGLTPSYADPEDCTKFYVCQGLRAIQMSCPSGLYYNSELYVCDWPWAVECDSQPSRAVSVLIV